MHSVKPTVILTFVKHMFHDDHIIHNKKVRKELNRNTIISVNERIDEILT